MTEKTLRKHKADMKIGILTFHSQLNYGGVLQCWALQTVLEKMGHEVVVIDRWMINDNSFLERGYDKWGRRQWVKFWIRSLLGLEDLREWLRVRRTKKFLRRRIHLSGFHFIDWKNAPADLGVDALIVGSDQVWHCGDWGDPRVYLLEGAPKIPAIAYAASFGLSALPKWLCESESPLASIEASPFYRRGLARFKAISCRESEGVEICRSLGFSAAHVVDPTLLTPPDGRKKRQRELVCYFLSERVGNHLEALERFAKKHHCRVKVFVNRAMPSPPLSVNAAGMRMWLGKFRRKLMSRVSIEKGAGPEEFFKAFQKARWVVSDSFHALMFSIRNECNVRIVRPTAESRRMMFARIEEFAHHAAGPLVADSVEDALESLSRGESVRFDSAWLSARRKESLDWLEKALA